MATGDFPLTNGGPAWYVIPTTTGSTKEYLVPSPNEFWTPEQIERMRYPLISSSPPMIFAPRSFCPWCHSQTEDDAFHPGRCSECGGPR